MGGGTAERGRTEPIGHSVRDPRRREGWVALVEGVERLLAEEGLEGEVLFHGADALAASSILSDGMVPTDASWAVDPETLAERSGSFWACARMAAAYAEDTVSTRSTEKVGGEPGGGPALLAVLSEELSGEAELLPDLATLDFPLDGFRASPAAEERWLAGKGGGWRESLRDLGAVVACHDGPLPPSLVIRVTSPDDVRALAARLSPRSGPRP